MTDPNPVAETSTRMDRAREPISSEVAQVLITHLLGGAYQPGQRLPSGEHWQGRSASADPWSARR